MKKLLAVLLALSACFMLTACGARIDAPAEGEARQENEAGALTFALGTTVYQKEHTASDGTLLLTERYELPRLELRTADGSLYELPTDAANMVGGQPPEAAVCARFNEEMDKVLVSLRESGEMDAASAQDTYAAPELDWDSFPFAVWSLEETVKGSYLSEKLLSVWSGGYGYWGGAHPNTYTRAQTFDLTTGEFLTLDSLGAERGNPCGETLRGRLSAEIFRQIDAQGLGSEYFDDYASYVSDLAYALYYVTEGGIVIVFDPYTLAPYAAGAQEFLIPYSAFYNTLSDDARSLLSVSAEEKVLADYRDAQTLWSWFYLTTAPVDEGSVGVNVEGATWRRAAFGDGTVTSLDALRALLRRYVSAEVAEEWLGTGRFMEVNGGLYTADADRGSNMDLADERFAVEWTDETGGTLVQTVSVQAYDAAGELALTGEVETYEYPFTLVDGHAVFSVFPCPW